jgi:hypothetical protein
MTSLFTATISAQGKALLYNSHAVCIQTRLKQTIPINKHGSSSRIIFPGVHVYLHKLALSLQIWKARTFRAYVDIWFATQREQTIGWLTRARQ